MGDAARLMDESHRGGFVSSKRNIEMSPVYQKDTFDFQGLRIKFLSDQDTHLEGTLQTRRILRKTSEEHTAAAITSTEP